MKTPHLYIAIPAMDETNYLPKTLSSVKGQKTEYPYSVYVCINQPEQYWNDPEKLSICKDNANLMLMLFNNKEQKINIIDCSSKGKGWKGKNFGVGWARKVLFDRIMEEAGEEDLLISLDADTVISENYLQSIGDNFKRRGDIAAISVPYYHKLTGREAEDRAILRYEIYMRNWLLNMFRIGSPYSFTAVGSAIAVRVKALRKIGGITPMKSGEDFYLMQKLCKMGRISNWNSEWVYPAARFSDRVFFGTGPAMIKGNMGEWERYPLYHYSLFDEIKSNYEMIPLLYHEDIKTSLTSFLEDQFKTKQLWQPLRKNATSLGRFERAFHEKADGLRLLQYLKHEQKKIKLSDEEVLCENWDKIIREVMPQFIRKGFSFNNLSTEELNRVRDIMVDEETSWRKRE